MNSVPVIEAPIVSALAGGLDSSVIDQATADLIARVNATSVTIEEMCLAAVEIQTRLLKGCNRDARLRCLDQVFDGQEDKVVALNFRLEAMGRVVKSGKIRPWVLPNIVRDIVFVAAVNAPLLCVEKQWYFEQDTFVASLLDLAHVDGHA
jgi:hypothetical protein